MITFYGYDKCSTCRMAKTFLQQRGIAFNQRDITQTPPPKQLLERILASGEYALSELFNRSGELYRSLNMKDRIKTLPQPDLLSLLSAHGKLIKRPVISDGARHVVGFDPERMTRFWG